MDDAYSVSSSANDLRAFWFYLFLAIKEIAHCLSAGRVRFARSFALDGVHAALRGGLGGFGDAALRAAVGETGFVRLQLELFRANDTDFDGECHLGSMIQACPYFYASERG